MQKNKKCYICKRNSHTAYNCYAKTDNNGNYLKAHVKRCCRRCGSLSHNSTACYAVFDIFKNKILDEYEYEYEECEYEYEEYEDDAYEEYDEVLDKILNNKTLVNAIITFDNVANIISSFDIGRYF